MRRMLLATFAGTLVLFLGFVGAFAQSGGRSTLEGVWELRDVTTPKPDTQPVIKPTGLMFLSGNKYAQVFLVNSARPALPFPEVDKASGDQLRAVWGPYVANAGTFQVSGNTLTLRATVAKNTAPMAAGAFLEHTFTLEGDNLTLTATKTDRGPEQNPRTFKLVRAK